MEKCVGGTNQKCLRNIKLNVLVGFRYKFLLPVFLFKYIPKYIYKFVKPYWFILFCKPMFLVISENLRAMNRWELNHPGDENTGGRHIWGMEFG